MRRVKAGEVFLLLSDLLYEELVDAPERVRNVLGTLPPVHIRTVNQTDEVRRLRDAYLKAGILTPASLDDATHVALATVSGADAIVSWNFKHIVQLGKMKAYNEVNKSFGYPHLDIVSPRELEP